MPNRQPPTVNGPVNRVPCPHCGRPNDLRELDVQNLLDTGSDIVCGPVDRAQNTGHCGRMFQIVGIAHVKVIRVAPVQGQPRHALPQAQPAYTIGGRQVRRLR